MIKCTYGDLDRLRDQPNRIGPLSKLMMATEPSIVDKFRIGKFFRAIEEVMAGYTKVLGELGQKYGDPVKIQGNDSYQIRSVDLAAFTVEKAKIDSDTCELPISSLPLSSCEGANLTARDIYLLEPFVVAPKD